MWFYLNKQKLGINYAPDTKLKCLKKFVRNHFVINDNHQFYENNTKIKVRSSCNIVKGQQIQIHLFQIPLKTSGLYYCDIVNNASIAKIRFKFLRTLSAKFNILQNNIVIKDIQKCKHKQATKKKLRITFTTSDNYDGLKCAYKKFKMDGKFYYIKPVK